MEEQRYTMVALGERTGTGIGQRVTYAGNERAAQDKARSWEKWLLEVAGVHAVVTVRKEA